MIRSINIFFAIFQSLSLCFLCDGSAVADSPLIVHEWGTITTRHLPDGQPTGRLNRIEASEVLPAFVHKFEPPQTRNKGERTLAKTPLTPGRPDVTMRLETPVIYFYPGQDQSKSKDFKVEVSFRGGVINEFYPKASASVEVDVERINEKMDAGIIQSWNGEVLDNYVRGSITWSVADLPIKANILKTENSVWVAPRKTDSLYVEAISGESEKYLFYRGVAHLDALMQTRCSSSEVTLLAPSKMLWLATATTAIPTVWIVAVDERGEVAFRAIEHVTLQKDLASKTIQSVPWFTADQFRPENLAGLKLSMKNALVEEGLFPKEADAMLATWKKSYFEDAGRRIFYIVPSEWLAYHLPVKVSVRHELSRAFIGRIDLIDR